MSPRLARRRLLAALLVAALPLAPWVAWAQAPTRRLRAGPGNYRKLLGTLRAGDLLLLDPGIYERGLPLQRLAGKAGRPIVIEGPPPPARAVFNARPNAHTVSLIDVEHVVVRNLVLDGRGVPVDAVRAEGHARFAHHVTLEGLTIVNHGASQQNSGISTKCPAWGWTVRGNTIVGAGTGMYFGDSDGSDPFFASTVADNRIIEPIGYGIQIKHQLDRPAGAAAAPQTTTIRGNTIIKTRPAATPELARPNLLVGHWPLSGAGAGDSYLVHDNLLFDNPSEALFQGEGNLAFFNNLLFNPHGAGLRIRPHNDRPRDVAVFNNTIVAAALGVGFAGGEAGHARAFEHNIVFGNPAVESEVPGDNLLGDFENARSSFVQLTLDPDDLDLTLRRQPAAPASRVDERWLAAAAARADRLGRPRSMANYGACLAEPGGKPCR